MAWGMTSCINDVYDDITPGTDVEKPFTGQGREGEIRLSVATDFGRLSRASGNGDEFHDGNKTEWEVGDGRSYALLFRQADGSFYACKSVTLTQVEMPQDDNVTVEYEGRLKLLEEDLYGNPLQVLLFVNAKKLYENYFQHYTPATRLTDVLGSTWSGEPGEIGRDDNGLFTMCNSIFVTADGSKRITEPVTFDDLIIDDGDHFYTQDEIDEKTVWLQVERMVAKYSLSLPAAGRLPEGGTFDGTNLFTVANDEIIYCDYFNEEGKPHYVTRQWQARVEGWGINATERQGYWVKNIDDRDYYFTAWNEPANWRCNWAVDKCYNVKDYPRQYRYPANDPYVEYYEIKGEGNYLKNFSYNDLCNKDFGTYIYVPENTYDPNVVGDIDGRTNLLAGSHLVLCAELETNIPNGGAMVVQDLYRDFNNIFYRTPKDCFWALVRTFNMTLQSQTAMKFYLYDFTKDETQTEMVSYAALTSRGNYQLYYNGRPLDYTTVMGLSDNLIYFTEATIKGGDGQVIPWLDGMTISNGSKTVDIYTQILETSDPTNPDYGDLEAQNKDYYVRPATENDIKSLLLEWVGPVDHFNSGKMYYAAPTYLLTPSGSSPLYAVVRNNWYHFNLLEITKMGTSVDNLDQPILPDEVHTADRLNVSVDIIDWHRFTFTAPLL